MKIHPFEFIGAYKLFSEERFLLADEMGMFKTAQAIFANSKFREKQRRSKRKSMRTLIVTPTSVREHWVRELQQWAYPNGEINVVYARDLVSGIRDVKNSTWTIISYHLMSMLDPELVSKLTNIGFHHIISDEVHNAKNPDALRTRALKTIIDQADYASLLSGTPIPNTISDLYVLMSILDPEKHPFDPEGGSSDTDNFMRARQSFIQLYVERPQAVKELLHKKMLRRLAKDYIKVQVPELGVHRIEIPLEGRHLETYQAISEQDMNMGKKMMELTKVSLDPCLVNRALPRETNEKDTSDKYRELDEIIKREMSKPNGKVLAFTDLKTGVIKYLVEKYKRFGAVGITGDIATEHGVRERIRQQFQRDPRTRVLFSTSTMHEGVDLTAATAVVDVTIPLTPAERYQRWKRSARPGEVKKEKVDAYTLFTTVPGAQKSLEEALLVMVDSKERNADYLLRGMQLSLEELKEFDRTERIPRIVRAITSPSRAVFKHFLTWRSIGSESASKRIRRNPEISKYIAELYPEFSMTRNAAEVYVPIIKELERSRKLETKIDIGCGPGMLGYFLDEPTIGFDIDPNMIKVGRKLYPNNRLGISQMSSLPLRDNIADLIVCSLAFQMTEPDKERAQTLQEMSRILKKSGYAIITLPGGYINYKDIIRFDQVLECYGFSVIDRKIQAGKSWIDIYVLQKAHESKTSRSYNLIWKGDIKMGKK